MGKHELTKVEALKLITPVVDGEVTSEERKAFMDYISEHEDVRKKYESIKNIKSLVRSRCPCANAPDSLKKYLENFCQQASVDDEAAPIYDIPNSGPARHNNESLSEPNETKTPSRWWVMPVAASALLAALIWGFYNYFSDSGSSPQTIYNVEEYAYQHFNQHKGRFVRPTITTASLGTAEVRLANDYDMPMTVPAVQNAQLKGVVIGEFVPHYKAPMLEYYIPSEDQYIYIFAFRLDKLNKFRNLVRDSEAVKECIHPKDYHIHEVNGKHVVSWKWDNVWYAAISNQDGKTLASLVKPLQR